MRRSVACCFVLSEPGSTKVIGYYTLSATSIQLNSLPPGLARRLPRYPALPAALTGRLAVDLRYRGQRFGEFLLVDAIQRVLNTELEIAIVAIVVDAAGEGAARFYEHFDFHRFEAESLRLYLTIAEAHDLFTSA